jgi:hypothetical protein
VSKAIYKQGERVRATFVPTHLPLSESARAHIGRRATFMAGLPISQGPFAGQMAFHAPEAWGFWAPQSALQDVEPVKGPLQAFLAWWGQNTP